MMYQILCSKLRGSLPVKNAYSVIRIVSDKVDISLKIMVGVKLIYKQLFSFEFTFRLYKRCTEILHISNPVITNRCAAVSVVGEVDTEHLHIFKLFIQCGKQIFLGAITVYNCLKTIVDSCTENTVTTAALLSVLNV